MTEFKVGDRVRDLSDDEEGTIHTIQDGMARVDWDESGRIGGYNISHFPGIEPEIELVYRPTGEPKVDAIMGVSKPDPEVDMVEHPPHYNSHPKGIECIEVIEDNPFILLGNAMKYLWRVSWGGKGNDLEDLKKAVWYIQREISRREA